MADFLPHSVEDESSLSPLESLPPELFAMVIEHVPESVLKLRRASKQLKSRIEDFARSCTLRFVEILEIEDYERGIRDEARMNIELTISKRLKPLYELRFRLLANLATIETQRYRPNTKFEWYSDRVADSEIEHLCQLIGRTVKQVTIEDELSWAPRVIHISKLLDHLQFTHLRVNMECLRDASIAYIKATIGRLNIEHFHIALLEEDTTQGGEQILLELSSVLRTLHIYQHDYENIDRSRNFMCGIYDANWAQLITGMFARKLDRLDIESQMHDRYLTVECRNFLRQQLPLTAKKIWLRAVTRSNATVRHERNGFLIEIDNFNLETELRVRHSSRLNEKDDLFYFDSRS